jgi:hypothetical protein
MVKVTITLQRQGQAWHVRRYDVEVLSGQHTLPLDPPPTRKFISQRAGANYVGRMVLDRLKRVSKDETGTDIVCDIQVLPCDEPYSRSSHRVRSDKLP